VCVATWFAGRVSGDGLPLFVFFQFLEDVEVAKGGLLQVVVDLLDGLLGGALAVFAAFAAFILAFLEGAGVGDDDAFAVLVELDDLEVESLTLTGFALVFLVEVAHRGESLDVVGEHDGGALVVHVDDLALVDRADGEEALVDVPGVLLELLVSEAEATVFGVDFEDDHVDLLTDLGELGGVFDFLAPAEVADVDEAIDAFFKLDEDAEVGEVADGGGVFASDGVALGDAEPGVGHELADAEAHLAVFAVEVEDDGFDLVADLEEVLCGAEVLAPAHLADVDETFDAGHDLDEGAVVGDDDHFTFDVVTFLEVGVEGIPGVRSELLEAEGDAALGLVEVEDDDVDLLVEADDLFGVVDAAPAEVGDVDEAIHAAEVDEDTVAGDVLHHAFEDLTLLEVADDLGLLSLDLVLDEGFVANDDVLVFVVDFDYFELHLLADVDVVVADGFDIDLATGEEGFDVFEDGDDQAAFGAALDVAGDDFLAVVGLVDALPALEDACFLVAEHELAVGIFLALDVDFDFVAGLEVGVVAKFAGGDDTVALGADVDDGFAVVDGDDGALDDFLLGEGVEALLVGFALLGGFLLFDFTGFFFDGVPVELCQRLHILVVHVCGSCCFCVPPALGTGYTFWFYVVERQPFGRVRRAETTVQRYAIFMTWPNLFLYGGSGKF